MEITLNVLSAFGTQIQTLLALIAADVILGVALAIKRGQFSFHELARFYQTSVLPLLVGWAAFAILARAAVPSTMGDYAYIASDTVVTAAWLAAVARVVSSIVTNAKQIYGEMFPAKPDDGVLNGEE